MAVSLINISLLKEHEHIDKNNLKKVLGQIKRAKHYKVPIIVDKEYYVILDGHHRMNSCKILGLTRIPCVLVNYLRDNSIKVVSRKKQIRINKEIVIEHALTTNLFPCKTTKHYIPQRVKGLFIPLNKLS